MEKYTVEQISENRWEITDNEHGVKIEFTPSEFDKGSKQVYISRTSDVCDMTEEERHEAMITIKNGMRKHLKVQHPELMERKRIPAYTVSRKDSGRIVIERSKFPRLTITVDDEVDAGKLAWTLSQMAKSLPFNFPDGNKNANKY